MPNALATAKTYSLAPMPALEPSLEAALTQSLHANAGYADEQMGADGKPKAGVWRPTPQAPSSALVTLAKASLPAVYASAGPVHPDILKNWLQRLANALPIGGTKDNSERVGHAVRALVDACGDFPAECFTAATLKLVLQRCEFFPTGAKLFELLEPTALSVKARVAQLERIAKYVPAPPEPVEMTAEERAEMGRKLSGLAANMRAKIEAESAATENVRPAYASKLELALSVYSQGVSIERMRPDLRAALEQHMAEQNQNHRQENNRT